MVISPPIGSGKPVPPRYKYPFRHMAVGEHFDVPDDRGLTRQGQSRAANDVCCAARSFAARNRPARKFTVRLVPAEGVVRCWRVS